MTKKECLALQKKLNALGAKLVVDGVYGAKTKAAEKKYLKDKPAPIVPLPPKGTPWGNKMREWMGRGERDSAFVAFLSGFWAKVGLPGYRTIVGRAFAWCGLSVATALLLTGHPIVKGAAGAKNWAKYGQEINWKRDGIPQDAIIHLDHDQDCKGGGNHVTLSAGQCAASDLIDANGMVKNVYVRMIGGNQGDMVKVSNFSAREICAVRYPPGYALTGKIEKSDGCLAGSASGESTR